MALQIEQQTRDIGVVRTTVGPERTRVIVRPGDTIRFVDDTGQPLQRVSGLRVRRLDNNLLIDGLPDGRVVELNNFFGACRPGAECSVSLEGIAPAGAPPITEESAPSAALVDGSFLLYAASGAAADAALPVTTAAEAAGGPSWLAIGGAAAGLAVAAAAAGGGGGGGGGPVADTTPPGAPVVTSGAVLKGSAPVLTGEAEAGARVTVRVDVNGNGAFTDAGDLVFATTADGTGRWSVDLNGPPQSGTPPAGGFADGRPYAVLVQAADAALNASPAVRTVVTVDSAPPAAPVIDVVSGDGTVNAPERAAGIVVTGSAEAGSSVAVTIGGATVTGTANPQGQFAATFLPAQLPAAGLATVTAVATDAVGNASAPASRSINFATQIPGAPVITDNAAGTASGPVTFTYTFSEAVTGFGADDVRVTSSNGTGGTAGALVAVSPTVYTQVVTPLAGQQLGEMVVEVRAGAGVNALGNPTAGPSTSIQAYDSLAPSVTSITSNASPPVNAASGPVSFTFTFSEAVTGFTASDVAITNGSAAGPIAGAGNTYTLAVTPAVGASGTLTVSVPAGGAIDQVGLGNAASGSFAGASVPFDTARPTLAITDNASGTAVGPVTFTFTFSEAVTGFDAADIVASGGASVGAVSGSGAVYTAVITPPAGSGTFTVDVAAGAASDAAGNGNVAAPQASQPFAPPDAVPPTVSVTDGTAAAVTNAATTFTFTTSEPVTGFTSGDVTVAGGAAGTFTAVSATVYTQVVTPTAATASGTMTVSVAAGAFADLAGNASTTGGSGSQAYDTVAPTVVITDAVAGTATAAVTFTFTFSESVSGFTAADIVASGGASVGAVSGSGAVYTAAITPPAGTGTFTVDVAAGAATDGAGNGSAAAAQVSQAYGPPDTTPPTVTVTDGTAAPVTSAPTTFTFTTSEAVTGFTSSDIAVTGGAAGTFTAVSATVYTLVVTPTAGVSSGTMTATVGAGAFNDLAGNANTTGGAGSQGYDTEAPTQTASAVVNETPGPGTVAIGGSTADTTPQITITLNAVIGAGETVSLSRIPPSGPAVALQTYTAGSGASLVFQEPTALASGTHAYTATIADSVGNVRALDLNPAPLSTDYVFTVT